jgi:hypothetical protein
MKQGAQRAKPQFFGFVSLQIASESGSSGSFFEEAILGCPLAQLRPKQLPMLLGKLCQTDP